LPGDYAENIIDLTLSGGKTGEVDSCLMNKNASARFIIIRFISESDIYVHF
jgi:hypothetical protein